MIQITPQMQIFLCVKPADFRRGIDGLSALCRQWLSRDPFSGEVFVFRNRRSTSIKILVFDTQGFWLCQKRLSKGKFCWWPGNDDRSTRELAAHELHLLIWNGNPERAGAGPVWKPYPKNYADPVPGEF